ncbi:T-cell-specific surface glycoprotein CD28-like [Hemiscyllium ocellatum]|uniref:T-cell-specific surface glycoprotein CD28-like n=1 Tax=Hemiscyllium ocellatum TaxID=170820 RepID=UPI0029664469|nr:T-cell-specific surface glycoprotein CD28-like [Hemiscyllium ocellatum]XP_060682867.1 T-cell-specific surface glycoprotein CD28-like [Hemiscyllium ocellatum]
MHPFKWSLPLMVACTCWAGDQSKVSVSQHPGEINVSVGMTAVIACEANYHRGTPEHTDMYWYKGNRRDQPILAFSKDSKSLSSQDDHLYVRGNLSKVYSILVINNLTVNDSGVYVCEVLVSLPPPHVSGYGHGTRLTVHESNSCQTSKAPQEVWKHTVFLAILAYSLAVTITTVSLGIFMCVHKRSKGRPNSKEALRSQEESSLTSSRKSALALSTDRAREAQNQEYEDMALIRTMSQIPR